jgi:hypothetical protein
VLPVTILLVFMLLAGLAAACLAANSCEGAGLDYSAFKIAGCFVCLPGCLFAYFFNCRSLWGRRAGLLSFQLLSKMQQQQHHRQAQQRSAAAAATKQAANGHSARGY